MASLVSLNINLPRYMLEAWWGAQHLGYYAALANLATVGNILMQPLGQVHLSRMACLGQADPAAFRRLLARILGLATLVGTAGALASTLYGQQILAAVYQSTYAALNPVLTWLMIGSAVTYVSSMLGYAMTARRLFRVQVPLYGMGCGGVPLLVSGLRALPRANGCCLRNRGKLGRCRRCQPSGAGLVTLASPAEGCIRFAAGAGSFPSYGERGAIGMTKTTENDQPPALSRNSSLPIRSPARGRPVTT